MQELSSITRLTRELGKLPGVGEKTALRFILFILKNKDGYAESLTRAVLELKDRVRFCNNCFSFTENDICEICSSPSREKQTVCIVETPAELALIEKSGVFSWQYHVLHGLLNPIENISPEDLRIEQLLERVRRDNVSEIVFALNPTIEGETTILYLCKHLSRISSAKIKLTKIAQGVPLGLNLNYLDHETICKALENRVEI